MSAIPAVKRDRRLFGPQHVGSLTRKVVLLYGGALTSATTGLAAETVLGAIPVPPIVAIGRKDAATDLPAPLILSPGYDSTLFAQHKSHSSHSSHASHYSGSTSAVTPHATPATVAPKTVQNAPKEAKPADHPPTGAPAGAEKGTGDAKGTIVPDRAAVAISSTPALGEIAIDGKYAGDTRSTIRLIPGTHEITVKKAGYAPWARTIEVTAGDDITVHADLHLLSVPDTTHKAAPKKQN